MNKSIVITATQIEQEFFLDKTAMGKSISKLRLPCDVTSENSKGLSQIYNEAIEKYKNDYEWLIFAHDDVFICDAFIEEKLDDGRNTHGFDIIGVAGSRFISLKSPVIAWHIGNDSKTDWSGAVAHPLDKERIYVNSYGPFFEPVLTLDGLFIACHRSIFHNEKVKFDEQFTFDFYDMDFCINAFRNNCKLGTVDIFLEHTSHGQALGNEKYIAAQKKFVEKWKDLQPKQETISS